MARSALALLAATALLLAGCGGGGGGDEAGSTVSCDDAAFRAQDEELYVTKAAVSNAMGGAGDPAALLLDLRRARTALVGYLDAHPPCDETLVGIESTEREAITALDDAIAALEADKDAGTQLGRALETLTAAQSELSGA